MHLGYPERVDDSLPQLPNLGEFHWRAEGEKHAWSPESISNLQVAARANNEDAYWKFAHQINADNRNRCTLRGLLDFKETGNSDFTRWTFSPPAKSSSDFVPVR